jgi:lysophospholipase L1-like esterase
MPAVLCYGDSNTWGYTPATQDRMGRWDRWPGVCQRELGDDVHVIEEGQNGRTTVFDVPFEPDRNGLTYLPVSLQTHAPLDAVVISLGTNDVFLPGVNAYHAAHGAMKLAEVALASAAGPAGGAPSVLVVVPPPFAPLSGWDLGESPDAERESQRFSQAFRDAAAASLEWDQIDIPLLDLRDHVTSSPVDGIHFEAEGHHAIGVAVATAVRGLLQLD